ncbi:unnamed protein product [Closterium sp. NIES-54]
MHRDDQEQPPPRCALRPASSCFAHRADRAAAVAMRKAASFWRFAHRADQATAVAMRNAATLLGASRRSATVMRQAASPPLSASRLSGHRRDHGSHALSSASLHSRALLPFFYAISCLTAL